MNFYWHNGTTYRVENHELVALPTENGKPIELPKPGRPHLRVIEGGKCESPRRD